MIVIIEMFHFNLVSTNILFASQAKVFRHFNNHALYWAIKCWKMYLMTERLSLSHYMRLKMEVFGLLTRLLNQMNISKFRLKLLTSRMLFYFLVT